jgi:tricarballylate dehydrogenase
MSDANGAYDVAVIGGGNAGLCAALTARAAGARVIVLDAAPRALRGGNSRHTRNLRCAHAAPTELLTGAYPREELLADLREVNGGESDAELASLLAAGSEDCVPWLRSLGVRFQGSLRGTLQLERTNAFFLGGGTALMNTLYAAAAHRGVDVRYDAEVVGLDVRDGVFRSARVHAAHGTATLRAKSVVLAAGGFEANLDRLAAAWGQAARNFIVRGTPYNRGTVLELMLDAGATPVGDAAECHAVAVDGRAPKFDGGIVTRLDCVPFGATRSGASSSLARRTRWPMPSSTPRSAARSCRRHFRRSKRSRYASSRAGSSCRPSGSRRPSWSSIAPCSPARSTRRGSTIAIPKA